jgi:NADH:ubiquinone reductase (H+-translocating)
MSPLFAVSFVARANERELLMQKHSPENDTDKKTPRLIIVGGGFAGLNTAKGLDGAPLSITLLDRHNYHLFQPLLYQVATAVLSPADIASPIRRILRDQANIRVGMAEVKGIDLANRRLLLPEGEVSYDYLVLAAGVNNSYFGHDQWQHFAPGLKTIEDALEIRRRVLVAFEEAEWEEDAVSRQAKLTFVVVGGGPTGVEMAGALKEIAARAIPRDFRFIDTTTARVILVEAGERLLPGMAVEAGLAARRQLEQMGVEVQLGHRVTEMAEGEVRFGTERLAAANIIWAAGVRGEPLAQSLGIALDGSGRVPVQADLSLPGYPEVFVIGDLAHVQDPHTNTMVPGVAPAAIQMGRHVAQIIRAELTPGEIALRAPFVYRDKGTMATVGRNRAVAAVRGRIITGFAAWLLWCLVHIWSLVEFRKRVFVFFSWLWSYFSFTKSARLITYEPETQVKTPRGILKR